MTILSVYLLGAAVVALLAGAMAIAGARGGLWRLDWEAARAVGLTAATWPVVLWRRRRR